MPGEGPSLLARRALQGADAAAICEAVQRPTMRFVPIKSEEQQSRLMVHRARQGYGLFAVAEAVGGGLGGKRQDLTP